MTLDELLGRVRTSSSDDWHKFVYRTPYVPYCGEYVDTNCYLAIFKPDIDISLAYGAAIQPNFEEPWVMQFPDPHATSEAVVLRYQGTPVYECRNFVTVDGGRYLLPMPEVPSAKGGKYQISDDRLSFARLMFNLFGIGGASQTLEEVLRRADIEIVPAKENAMSL